MAQQVAPEAVEEGVGVALAPAGDAVGERVERAGGVAGLGDAVRVQQQEVSRLEREAVDVVARLRQFAQAQRGRRAADVRRRRSAVAQDDRRRVPAGDHPDRAVAVGDVQNGGGDERFSEAAGLVRFHQVPAHAPVEVGHQFVQVRPAVGGDAKRPEQQGGVVDRGHPLALDVADDQPGPRGRAGRRVQVSADPGLRLGGEIEGGGAQGAELPRQRRQDHTLGDLGHVPHLRQLFRATLPQDAEDHQARADQDQGDDLCLVVGRE